MVLSLTFTPNHDGTIETILQTQDTQSMFRCHHDNPQSMDSINTYQIFPFLLLPMGPSLMNEQRY